MSRYDFPDPEMVERAANRQALIGFVAMVPVLVLVGALLVSLLSG